MRQAGLLCLLAPFALLGGSLLSATAATSAEPEPKVDYNRDVRPILSDNCYLCHGPDSGTRLTDWRLDLKESALGETDSGEVAIEPGKSDASELARRIRSTNKYERMPPPRSKKELSQEQIATLVRWIDQGAPWEGHWSFVAPKRPTPPEVADEGFVHNPIDRFVLARLRQEGLSPSPASDKTTLIRRVTFDLTGLPPTLDEVDAFLADESPQAYEKLVDRLLDSPARAEHMARYWLDSARYADTHGLHLDNLRSMWLYRDWVIDAFAENKRFDQFTIEQLAGDLLPDATPSQHVASGFNRAHVTTSEGGSIAEEYVVRYAVDRTETMGKVWMGLTVGCAVCHDHKFDPISQKEFYQLYAYFNNTAENPMDGNQPYQKSVDMKVPTSEQTAQFAEFDRTLVEIRERIRTEVAKVEYEDPGAESEPSEPARREVVWIDDALPKGAKPAADAGTAWQFVEAPEHPVHSGKRAVVRTAEELTQNYFTEADPGLTVGEGDVLFTHVYLDPDNPPLEIMLQFNDGTWEHRAYWGEDRIDWGTADTASRRAAGALPEHGKWVRLEIEAAKVGLSAGAVVRGWAFTQFGGTVYWDSAGIVTHVPQGPPQNESLIVWERAQRAAKAAKLPEPVRKAILVEPETRDDAQRQQIRDHFIEHVYAKSREQFAGLHGEIAAVEKQKADLDKQIPWTLVTRERPERRMAHFLNRGAYDKPGDEVQRNVPAVLPPLPEDAPDNRLGLARWLVDPGHPLTARVAVNRLWQQHFGTGLVKTSGDFGSQGEWPSHPKLLDWLAAEFIDSGWNVRHMQRLMVTSATYRQSSRVSPAAAARDPENRMLARGSRYRLDAEMVRDNALATSGLLVQKLGGPSVKPYQPDGLWFAVAYTSSNTARFKQDQGDALYRRSLYTFWKRTSPPPTMLLLDAPSRETCVVHRARTNTPLAALALMNDVQFFEAARKLAERMMLEGGSTVKERAAYGFRLATARRAGDFEIGVLLRQFETHLAEFRQDAEAAAKVVAAGESPRDESLDVAELAAWTMVANLILNLDETLTKG